MKNPENHEEIPLILSSAAGINSSVFLECKSSGVIVGCWAYEGVGYVLVVRLLFFVS